MTRPWVAVIVGVCGFFTVVIAANRFLRGNSADPSSGPPRVAALAATAIPQRGGWSAREGVDETNPPGSGGGSRQSPSHTGQWGQGSGQPGGVGGGAASGGATAMTGASRGNGGTLGYSASAASRTGGGSIGLSALPEASVRFENNRGASAGHDVQTFGGLPHELAAGKTDDNADANPEDGGPVLSLPLEQSADPERGEAPVAVDGVTFDSGEGAKFSTDAQFAIPNAGNLTGEAGSISFSIQPDWRGDDGSDASLVQLRTANQWENRLQIFKNGRFLRFLLADNTGVESGAGIPIDNWQPGQDHHVTATWGEALLSLYVDGRLVGQATYPGQFVPPSGPLFIGSDLPGGMVGAHGTISRFQAYNRALAANEVGNLSQR